MGTVIVVTSGKGGTGKTVCCAALGSALSLLGHRTLCVDCDVGLRNLDQALGLSDVLWDFNDVLLDRADIEDAVISPAGLPNLGFLSAPWDTDPSDISADRFSELLDNLRDAYDYILVDSPAGLGTGFRLASKNADMAIIVVNPDISSVRDGQRTVQRLEALDVFNRRLLINRVAPKLLRQSRMDLDEVIDSVGAKLLGVVSEDEALKLALASQTPLMLYGARLAYDQFFRIARRVAGERVHLGRTF